MRDRGEASRLGTFLAGTVAGRAVTHALVPAFVLLTLPGVVASALLQRVCDAAFLPSVEAVESGERELPYAGLVAATALPFLVLTAGGVAAFAASASRSGHAELLAIWIGVSLVVHAIPGEGATAAVYGRSLQSGSRLRWLGLPVAAFARTIQRLQPVWLDLVYALGVFAVVRGVLAWL